MKTIKNLLSIFVIITSLTFISCENEPIDASLLKNTNSNNSGGGNTGGGNSGGNSPTYYVKVKIDGVQKQWTGGTEAFGVFMNNGTIFSILCNTSGGSDEELVIAINNALVGPISATNYPYEWALITAAYTNNVDNYASAYSDFTVSPGGINITQINTSNKTVKGTFTFVGKNDGMTVTKNFTNGEFFLQYP